MEVCPDDRSSREPADTEVDKGRPTTLGRGVGIFVSMVVVSAAGLLGLAVWAGDPQPVGTPRDGVVLDAWKVLYDTAAPSFSLILTAISLAVLGVTGIAAAERVVTDRARRSTDKARRPLAPRTIMAGNRGEYAGPVTITVLVPAHDERASIGATLVSLAGQSRPPERVLVVADNCSDDTARIARRHGAEVIETIGNTEKKAGALNQVLAELLDELGDNDCVMVVDADTVLDPGFLAFAVQRLTDDRAIMSIGGLFYGDDTGGLLAQFQRNEYVRYSRELERRRGRVYVLTGTASIFRSAALREVADSRGSLLPGVHGDVYDTASLTEDNELTLALKSLGALMCSPHECRVVTELMPTWSHLWTQRLRWQRGALENLGAYGFKPALVRYWAQQLGIGYSVIALSSFWLLLCLTMMATPDWVWYPFWLGIGGIFVADRIISVWQGGWRARILAMLLFPELVYDVFLDVVYVRGVLDITLARQATWGHVPHEGDAPVRATDTDTDTDTEPGVAA
jgi:cellulose synthase/poly-beta-1,6-N-acetylglucosamine synthase-like glycosyltransferase